MPKHTSGSSGRLSKVEGRMMSKSRSKDMKFKVGVYRSKGRTMSKSRSKPAKTKIEKLEKSKSKVSKMPPELISVIANTTRTKRGEKRDDDCLRVREGKRQKGSAPHLRISQLHECNGQTCSNKRQQIAENISARSSVSSLML